MIHELASDWDSSSDDSDNIAYLENNKRRRDARRLAIELIRYIEEQESRQAEKMNSENDQQKDGIVFKMSNRVVRPDFDDSLF
jgi:hypothetical protein